MTKYCLTIVPPTNFPSEFSTSGKRHNIDLEITQQVALSKFSFQENFSKSLIQQNFPFALQSRVNPYFHSHENKNKLATNLSKKRMSCAVPKTDTTGSRDNSFKVLPLTLQSEIKQHQIISLIKENC